VTPDAPLPPTPLPYTTLFRSPRGEPGNVGALAYDTGDSFLQVHPKVAGHVGHHGGAHRQALDELRRETRLGDASRLPYQDAEIGVPHQGKGAGVVDIPVGPQGPGHA